MGLTTNSDGDPGHVTYLFKRIERHTTTALHFGFFVVVYQYSVCVDISGQVWNVDHITDPKLIAVPRRAKAQYEIVLRDKKIAANNDEYYSKTSR